MCAEYENKWSYDAFHRNGIFDVKIPKKAMITGRFNSMLDICNVCALSLFVT